MESHQPSKDDEDEGGHMPWWAWLLVAWSLVAVSFAVFAGAAAKVIQREERLAPPTEPPREPPVEPPAPPLRDPVPAPEAGAPASARQTGFSAGSRTEPRR
jgi:hypothetical protein